MKLNLALIALVVVAVAPFSRALEPDGSCRLISLLAFSDTSVFTPKGGKNQTTIRAYDAKHSRWSPDTIAMTGFSFAAAALMAMDHFNNRDASVVPEIANLPDSCTAVFSNDSIILDGALSNVKSGELLFEAALESKPCAIVGPLGIIPSSWTSSLSASLDVPQLFYATAPSIVTDPDWYPTTIRVSLRTHEYVSKILSYVKHNLKRDYLAILLGGSDYDRMLATFFEQYGVDFNITVVSFKLFPASPKQDPREHSVKTFGDLKKSGIRTIFRTFIDEGTRALERLAESVHAHGLLGDDYVYILEEHVAPVDDLPRIVGAQTVNSPLDKLLSGAIVLSPADAWESGEDSAFLQSWRSNDEAFVDLLQAKVPLKPGQKEYFQAAPDFFQTHDPRRGTSNVYDSVMAAGFGACRAQMAANSTDINGTTVELEGNETGGVPSGSGSSPSGSGGSPPQGGESGGPPPGGGPPPEGGGPPPEGGGPPPEGGGGGGPPPGGGGNGGPPPEGGGDAPKSPNGGPPPQRNFTNAHVKGIVESTFTGASGRVSFSIGRDLYRDRIPEDVSYGAYNIRPVNQPDGMRTYEVVLVTRTVDMEWQGIPGEAFRYRDGTTVLKGKSREMWEENYLPNWVRIFGLLLMAVAWIVTLGLLFAVWYWRDKPLVKAGQPVFLYIVCLGALMTSTAILTLSFDEASGWSDDQLDSACIMTPWLFFLGINSTFAGLFCKLWRVDQVTQFRRRQVKVIQAAWPLIVLLLSTAVCLLVWTVVDPWTWKREIIHPEILIPSESYGKCDSDNFTVYFSVLSALMILATALAFAMAWKTKDLKLDSRFSDTNTVFLAIASQLQAWFVGLPILAVLNHSSVEATYLGRVLLIWLFSVASVLIVIAPKIFNTWRNPAATARTSRVFVSGLSTDVHSSISGGFGQPAASNVADTNSTVSPSVQTREIDQERPLDSAYSHYTPNSSDTSGQAKESLSSVSRVSERLDV